MKDVEIICPLCKTRKRISLNELTLTSKDSGASSVLLNKGVICEHSFTAYIDRNLMVRDYMVVQFTLKDHSTQRKELMNRFKVRMDQYDFSLHRLQEDVSLSDFQILFCASFIAIPIILIEEDLSQERLYNCISNILSFYPQMENRIYIVSPAEFLNLQQSEAEIIKMCIVHNLIHKLFVQVPFSRITAEICDDLMHKIVESDTKLTRIYMKNTLDYLSKYYQENNQEFEKPNSDTMKRLQKKYPKHAEYFELEWLEVFRLRKEYHYKLLGFNLFQDEQEDPSSSKHHQIYKYKKAALDITMATNKVEELALKLIFEYKKITLEELFHRLKTRNPLEMGHWTQDKLTQVLDFYIEMDILEKI